MLKLIFCLFLGASAVQSSEPGTTGDRLYPELMRRCQLFRSKVFKERLMSASDRDGLPGCEAITTAMISAFAHKGPCDVTASSYDQVIGMTMKSLGPNTVTLWSGVYTWKNDFAKAIDRYVLETGTFLGVMGDGLTFCGKKEGDGIGENCPAWGECSNGGGAVENFWQSISKAFAMTAEGNVKILLLGTGDRAAYRPSSVLGSIELPTIFDSRPRRVTSLTALIAFEPFKRIREACGTGSMEEMQHLIQSRDIPYQCINNPKEIANAFNGGGYIIGSSA